MAEMRSGSDKIDPDGCKRFTIKRLLSPRDEAIDLGADAYSRALKLTLDGWQLDPARSLDRQPPKIPSGPNIRRSRHSSRGLLLIYPFFPPPAESSITPLIGFAVSFPGATPSTRVTYRVNNLYWTQEIGETA